MHVVVGSTGCNVGAVLSSSWNGDEATRELARVVEGAGAPVAAVGASVADAVAVGATGAAGGARRLASRGSNTACTSVTAVVGAEASVAPELACRRSVSAMGICQPRGSGERSAEGAVSD